MDPSAGSVAVVILSTALNLTSLDALVDPVPVRKCPHFVKEPACAG